MIQKTGNKLVDLYDIFMDSLARAQMNKSNLPDKIIDFEPMWSCPKMRHFLNNLCSHEEVVYFECGVARGSTLISALYDNNTTAYACDLWLEEKLGTGSRDIFNQNCEQFSENLKKSNMTFFNGSCWDIVEQHQDKFSPKPNVFFYDAGHSIEDHRRAVSHFLPVLSDDFLMIVDDFADHRVCSGTLQGLDQLVKSDDVRLINSVQLLGIPPHAFIWNEGDRKPETTWSDNERWGNGIWIGLFRKSRD